MHPPLVHQQGSSTDHLPGRNHLLDFKKSSNATLMVGSDLLLVGELGEKGKAIAWTNGIQGGEEGGVPSAKGASSGQPPGRRLR